MGTTPPKGTLPLLANTTEDSAKVMKMLSHLGGAIDDLYNSCPSETEDRAERAYLLIMRSFSLCWNAAVSYALTNSTAKIEEFVEGIDQLR